MGKVIISKKYRCIGDVDTRYIYLHGGRGSGKSFASAMYLAYLSYEPGHKILFTRYTIASASRSIIPEFVEKLRICDLTEDFHVTQSSVINKLTGVEILFNGIRTSSGNQTANLKSLNGITTWCYEEFEEHPDEDSFDTIDLSVREDKVQNRVILISNALHKESWQYKRFFENPTDTTHIYTTYKDNADNLNAQFLRMAEWTQENNPSKYRKNFLGLHYDDVDSALWNQEMIEYADMPERFDRIVVAVDPAVTSDIHSDETGIVVCGKSGNKGYVLEDKSGIYTPNTWAGIVVNLYHKWKADRIVGEVNNGGDLIEQVIKQQDKSVYYKSVRASKGKAVRAEPIVNLYEQRAIKHVKRFPELELQMTTWVPTNKRTSPDRIDALVWGFSEILLRNNSGWVI